MKVAFVLGEESADRIGAEILTALKRRVGPDLAVIGLGGHAMEREGLRSLFPIEELSIIGIGAILARLPQLYGRLRQTVRFLLAERPDVIVTIDSFTFTNRVALRVRERWPDVRIVNVAPPAVWAYRAHRAERLAQAVDHAISLFPFEPDALRQNGGPPATYVGHPLLSHPGLEAILQRDAAEGLRPASRPPHLVVLPGSRRGEIRRLSADFGRTVAILRRMHPNLRVTIPVVERVRALLERELASWDVAPTLISGDEAKWATFANADAALAASGTVALELALAGVPMVLAYRLDPVGYRLRHLMTGWTAALPNFVAGYPLVAEHYHEQVRPEHLARRLDRLLTQTPDRAAQMAGLETIRSRMRVDRHPSEAAADIILRIATRP